MPTHPHSYGTATRIIDAVIGRAFLRFDRYGFNKTTVDEIAADLHISKRTLYSVFPSKEAILREGVWRRMTSIMDSFTASTDVGDVPSERIIALTRYILNDFLVEGENGIFKSLHDADVDIRSAWFDALKRVFRDMFTEGSNAGAVAPFHPDLAADTMIYVLQAAFTHIRKASYQEDIIAWILIIISDTILAE